MKKAEDDYVVTCVLLRSRKRGRYDAICFHSQQCVEKYLKARLIEAGIPFPKTHELFLLLTQTMTVEPLWSVLTAQLRALSTWAVLPRYPGVNANAAAARIAVKTCRQFRELARLALGLNP